MSGAPGKRPVDPLKLWSRPEEAKGLIDATQSAIGGGFTVGVHNVSEALHFGRLSMTNIWALLCSLRKHSDSKVHPYRGVTLGEDHGRPSAIHTQIIV